MRWRSPFHVTGFFLGQLAVVFPLPSTTLAVSAANGAGAGSHIGAANFHDQLAVIEPGSGEDISEGQSLRQAANYMRKEQSSVKHAAPASEGSVEIQRRKEAADKDSDDDAEDAKSLEVGAHAAFKPFTQAKHSLEHEPQQAGPPGLHAPAAGGLIDSASHPLVAHWHLDPPGSVANNANTFEKISGNDEYDAEALTEHGNVMSIKVRALQTDKAFRIGLTSNEFDHADFEHGFFIGFYDRGRLYVPDWTISSYTPENEFGLVIESGQMTLWKDDEKLHTFPGTISGPMYASDRKSVV